LIISYFYTIRFHSLTLSRFWAAINPAKPDIPGHFRHFLILAAHTTKKAPAFPQEHCPIRFRQYNNIT
jgi:hypothetical protein